MIWLKFGISILIMAIIITIVKRLLRKKLKIEKVRRKPFSYNHINELHKKVDWRLRIISMMILFLSLAYIINNPANIYLFIIIVVLLGVLDYMVRAFFEWRYSEEPKQSILTITEMLLVVVATVIVVNYNLLGLTL